MFLSSHEYYFWYTYSFVLGIPYLAHDYTNNSNALDMMPTLVERRKIFNLNFNRGLVTNQIDSTSLLSLLNSEVPSHTSRFQNIFHIPRFKKNY